MSNSTQRALVNARNALGVLALGMAEAQKLKDRARDLGEPLNSMDQHTVARMERALAGQQQVVAELTRLLETPPEVRPDVRADLARRFHLAFARFLKGMPEPGRTVVADKILTEVGI